MGGLFCRPCICSPIKRSVVGVVSQFYDPIGILSPVIIVFKIFLQELTKAGMNWDEPLTDSLLERWLATTSETSKTKLSVSTFHQVPCIQLLVPVGASLSH